MITKSSIESQVAIVIGRWQLPHLGHDTLYQKALSIAPKVIVVIGSAFRSRDTRQPFTADERKDMILRSLDPKDRERITFLPVRDYYDDDRWDRAVSAGVAKLTERTDRIALVGFKKDNTTYYLDRFPNWKQVLVEPQVDIDASSLRSMFFGADDLDAGLSIISTYVKPGVLGWLQAWSQMPLYAKRRAEHHAVVEYRKQWNAPWYQTADALVRMNDHVLLVQRGGKIGYDLWAIPGGFVNPDERLFPAALRECKEETSFARFDSTMRSALKAQATFDHPLRSPRARILSQAYYFAFGEGELPEVHPGDDAKDARWVHISELPSYEDKLFEDHAAILDHFVGLFPKD